MPTNSQYVELVSGIAVKDVRILNGKPSAGGELYLRGEVCHVDPSYAKSVCVEGSIGVKPKPLDASFLDEKSPEQRSAEALETIAAKVTGDDTPQKMEDKQEAPGKKRPGRKPKK